MTDDQILTALGRKGGRTRHIAMRVFGPSATAQHQERVYGRLRRLEREKTVYRHPRFSAVNDIYWMPAGVAAESVEVA